jgi:hypothetical protein
MGDIPDMGGASAAGCRASRQMPPRRGGLLMTRNERRNQALQQLLPLAGSEGMLLRAIEVIGNQTPEGQSISMEELADTILELRLQELHSHNPTQAVSA